jgi:hypothetical protein
MNSLFKIKLLALRKRNIHTYIEKIAKIGFIGTGNMAQAIIQGLIKQKIFKPEQIYASDNDWEYIEFLQKNNQFFQVIILFFRILNK